MISTKPATPTVYRYFYDDVPDQEESEFPDFEDSEGKHLILNFRGKLEFKDWITREIAVGNYLKKNMHLRIKNYAKGVLDKSATYALYGALGEYNNKVSIRIYTSEDEQQYRNIDNEEIKKFSDLHNYFYDISLQAPAVPLSVFSVLDDITENMKVFKEKPSSRLETFYHKTGIEIIRKIAQAHSEERPNISRLIEDLNANPRFFKFNGNKNFYSRQVVNLYNLARGYVRNFIDNGHSESLEAHFGKIQEGQAYLKADVDSGLLAVSEHGNSKLFLNKDDNLKPNLPIAIFEPRHSDYSAEISLVKQKTLNNKLVLLIYKADNLKFPVHREVIDFSHKKKYVFDLSSEIRLDPGNYAYVLTDGIIFDYVNNRLNEKTNEFKYKPLKLGTFSIGSQLLDLGKHWKWQIDPVTGEVTAVKKFKEVRLQPL